MTDVDTLFSEFVAARDAGEPVKARDYLKRVDGADREELAALIEGHLTRGPRRRWSASRYAGSSAEAVVTALGSAHSDWPALLPRLRNEAQITRADLVRRLAGALGVSSREEKVRRYYHEMERGVLPARGVSDRVLDALGEIVGQSAATLRRAGEGMGLTPVQGASTAPEVYARAAQPDPEYADSAADGADRPSQAERTDDGEWDEVDKLFRGAG